MKRKGNMVYWSVSELSTTKEDLARLGFEKLIPRNDFKSAVIKALKAVTKGNEKLYRRFNDIDGEVSFGVFVENIGGGDITIDKELVIRLDKRTGVLSQVNATNPTLFDMIQRQYDASTKTIDSNQFRALVLRLVKQECRGVSMRAGGGIYYIDDKFEGTRDKLKALFQAFPIATRLESVPVYDDDDTLNAIENACGDEIFGEIEALKTDINSKFQERTMTRRMLEARKEAAQEIFSKIRDHGENLRSKAIEVSKKLEAVSKAMEELTDKVEKGIVEPEEFMAALEAL